MCLQGEVVERALQPQALDLPGLTQRNALCFRAQQVAQAA